MLPDEKVMCHHTGFEKSCFEMVTHSKCRKWCQIVGTNPQTGQPADRWDCVDALLPMLLIENAQQSRQTGAAVESFRNVVAAGNEQTALMLAEAARQTQGRIAS